MPTIPQIPWCVRSLAPLSLGVWAALVAGCSNDPNANGGSPDGSPPVSDAGAPIDGAFVDATVDGGLPLSDASLSDTAAPSAADGAAEGSADARASDAGLPLLAATPPMGWNSWNRFGGQVSEDLVEQVADAIVASGMQAAGYEYVNIDDGWAASRDGLGNIVPNAATFPDGMAALAAYVHGKGLKLGIYTCAGTTTCQGLPGSYGHEAEDAKTYAGWGIDYVKEDWCNTAGEDPATEYALMRDGILASGRPMVFSICDWGTSSPWAWGPTTGNLWRTTGDIADTFDSMVNNLDSTAEHPSAAGPGHWNDPDMLEVGNGVLSADESRAHFSLWSILAAPLIAGNDVRSMSADTLAILTNAEVIAVDADPAGVQGRLVADDGNGSQVWSKVLHTPGARAVALFNRGAASASITARWSDLGLAPGSAAVRDLWQHKDLGPFQDTYATEVASHAAVMLVVTGSEGTPAAGTPTVYAAAAGPNALTGTAQRGNCASCASGQKVGWIGTTSTADGGAQAGTLQFNGVQATTGGTRTIVIEYLAGENRSATVSVNGGAPLTVRFGESGPDGDYSFVGTHVLQVPLNAGSNTLLFANAAGPAPDLSAIDVYP